MWGGEEGRAEEIVTPASRSRTLRAAVSLAGGPLLFNVCSSSKTLILLGELYFEICVLPTLTCFLK